jgi:hypothetical protein
MTTYAEGFRDALKSQDVQLRPAEFLIDRSKAFRAGRKLGDGRDFREMTDEQILESLGPKWIELGKGYPKTLGLALVAAKINPDDANARAEALLGLRSTGE